MTYDALAKFEDLWKRIDSTLNPQWQKDMTNLYTKAAIPKLDLPTFSGPKIQDILSTRAMGLGQVPAFNNALKAYGESLSSFKTQARLQEVIKDLNRPLDLGNLGGVTVWRDLLEADPTILRGVAGEAFSAMNIGKVGGLTGFLGPKASAAAGLYGFTRSDIQGVHLSEDRALDMVLEATELLNDEENAAALADVEVDEALVEELEAFFLTSEASIEAYEAATQEIAVRRIGPKAKLKLRGMLVLSLFFVLYAILIGGIAAGKPGQEVTLPDHLIAVGGSITITTGLDLGAKYVDRIRKMPDDDEEKDLEEDPQRG